MQVRDPPARDHCRLRADLESLEVTRFDLMHQVLFKLHISPGQLTTAAAILSPF